MELVTARNFHKNLIQSLFAKRPSDEEALCVMLILHSCSIRLTKLVQVDGNVLGFAAITSRHAAEVIASLFNAGKESSYTHWYFRWNEDWQAYSILESPPKNLAEPLARIRDMIEAHPWVDRLVPDDWNIIDYHE